MSDAENKTPEPEGAKPLDLKKWRRRAIIAGVLLALVCKSLPADYQAPCETIARICTGGIVLP